MSEIHNKESRNIGYTIGAFFSAIRNFFAKDHAVEAPSRTTEKGVKVPTGEYIRRVLVFIKDWIVNHRRVYVPVLFVVLILVIVLCVKGCGNSGSSASGDADGSLQLMSSDSEIDTLMHTYYSAVADGDLTTLSTICTPISEKESSYITMMAQYVESYEDIQCYAKDGVTEGSYFVSVSMAMKFVGVATAAPNGPSSLSRLSSAWNRPALPMRGYSCC